jgi:cell division protein FtsB
MRITTVILVILLAMVQYPLWWGHGGWLRVHELKVELAQQQQKNAEKQRRNARMQGEVADLQDGTAAIEERARFEMSMVQGNEVFVQFVSPNATSKSRTSDDEELNTSTRGQITGAPLAVVPNPEPRPKREHKHGKRDEKERKAT